MSRSPRRRQSDSARTYLDFTTDTVALDAAAQLVVDTLGFPSCQINILDGTDQYTLAHCGPATAAAAGTVAQLHAVCAHTVAASRLIEIPDARNGGIAGTDVDVAHRADAAPAVVQKVMALHGLVAYVGMPLIGREGLPVGSLCVFDTVPHLITDAQRNRLALLAVLVEQLLDTHRDPTRLRFDHADAAALSAALTSGAISPWYQPIVDLETGMVTAVEALARWEHPTRGLLTPAHFIAVAEAGELIIDLDLTVLARGLVDLRRWHGIDDTVQLHVNFSGAHFAHRDCVERLTAMLRAADIEPPSVILEITEMSAFADSPANTEFVAALREAGFGVVLDDLGAGWSGVDRLLQFPLSGFKIDKAVTDRLGTPAGDAAIRALHCLATDLDMQLTVEGVEPLNKHMR